MQKVLYNICNSVLETTNWKNFDSMKEYAKLQNAKKADLVTSETLSFFYREIF
jgi:hypothetical protein